MERVRTGDVAAGGRAPLPPLAALLRDFRAAAELTQEELAERSGISVRAISNLERGAETRPQRATVDLLARGLGLNEAEQSALEAAVPSRLRPSDRVTRSLDLPLGNFLGSVPAAPLVARTHEVECIRDVVAIARGGEGRLLLLAGEPGVGKTRLAQEATVICRASGMYLATGRCYEPYQTLAFSPFLEILSKIVTVVRGRLGVDPLQRWPQLGPLVPDAPPDATPLRGEGDVLRLFWAVSNLFQALAGRMPVAVAIDDLHWADQSSLDLLQHLAHHLRHVPILLLGTYRPGKAGNHHRLSPVLRDIHRDQLANEISVARFDKVETAALMSSTLSGQAVSPRFVDMVHRHTEGNAYFVQEVTRALAERGDATIEDGVWTCAADREIAIPHTVHEAIAERLERLTDSTRAVLSQASVLGQTFDIDELSAMSALPDEVIEAALEEAVTANVARVGPGDNYTFSHVLTQQVLYHELLPRRRKKFHLAAAISIEGLPDHMREQRVAELAWHFGRGGERVRAMRYARQAGDQAERRFAHQEAERQYQAALRLADESDAAEEAAVREKLGRVLTNAGRFAQAQRELERAVKLFERLGDIEGQIRITVQLASVHTATGTSDAGIARVVSMLESVAAGARQQDLVELWIVLETLYFAAGRFHDGLEAAERAMELATNAGNVSALSRAETGRGSELYALGRLEEATRVVESAISRVDEADDPYNLVRAQGVASLLYWMQGEMVRSLELAEQSLVVQQRIQVPWGVALHLQLVGAIEKVLGNWARAQELQESAVKMCRAEPPSSWAIHPLRGLGSIYLDQGRREEGLRLVEEAAVLARSAGRSDLGEVERVLAEYDLLGGRADEARQRLERVLAYAGLEAGHVIELLAILAAARLACGDPVAAEGAAAEAIERATASGHMLGLALALRERAAIYAACEAWTAADRDFNEALRLTRTIPYPYLEGRNLLDWGIAAAKQGQMEKGRERMAAALTIFQRLGAHPMTEQTELALKEWDAG